MADFSQFAGRECPAWYAEPQLGIFIHWGMFAIPAFAPPGKSITELFETAYDDAFVQGPYAEWYENALRDPDRRDARKRFYRKMLRHHAEAQRLVARFRL